MIAADKTQLYNDLEIDSLVRLFNKLVNIEYKRRKKNSNIDIDLLTRLREFILSCNVSIGNEISKKFDFLERRYIIKNFMQASSRFNFHYFSFCDNDSMCEVMMRDAKRYIYPQKYEASVESCKSKDFFNVAVYVQSLILLGSHAPFASVLEYIKNNADQIHIASIINEIANYSKIGVEFFDYYVKTNNLLLSNEQNIFLRELKASNRCLKKSQDIDLNAIGFKQILREDRKLYNTKPEIQYDALNFFGDLSDTRKYLNAEKSKFDLATILCKRKTVKALIVAVNGEIFAFRDILDYNDALVKLLGFVGLTTNLPIPDGLEEPEEFDKYFKECVEKGVMIVKIISNGKETKIDTQAYKGYDSIKRRVLSMIALGIRKANEIKERTIKKHILD